MPEDIFIEVVRSGVKSDTHLRFLQMEGGNINYMEPDSIGTALTLAVLKGDIKHVQTLLNLGADVNLCVSHSPLMQACLKGYKEIIHLLLATPQIIVTTRDALGHTAASLCVTANIEDSVKVEILTSLMRKDESVILNVDILGFTLLHEAVQQKALGVITLLNDNHYPFKSRKSGVFENGLTALDMAKVLGDIILQNLIVSFYDSPE
jgi:ankyrin repeat protein